MRRATSDVERPLALMRILSCCVLSGLLGVWTSKTQATAELSIDIPSQPVAIALAEFARQTGLQLIYVSGIARHRESRGASAGLAPTEALQSLLDGTGLGFEYLNRRTVRIFEIVAAVPPEQSRTVRLPETSAERRASPPRQREEIIVTGPRVAYGLGSAENLRNVPASVSIVTGNTLEAQQLGQLSDYATYLPGVNVVSFGSPGWSAVILRGITSFPETATGAFYLDDTPIGPNGPWANACCEILDLMPYDLERIEVRRGPQGTHYGANSESGLVRFVLAEPSVHEFQARVGADGSLIRGASGAGGSLRVMANVPIVDNVLAVRVSAYDNYTPGYIDNVYTGNSDTNATRQTGGRLILLWHPAASVAVKVTAFWPSIETNSEADMSSAGVTMVRGTGDANIVKASGFYGDLTEHHAFQQPFSKRIDYYAATVNWDYRLLEIVSATAWSRTGSHSSADHTLYQGANFPEWSGGAVPAGLVVFHRNIRFEKFTEELHVAAPAGGRIAWMLGAFYTHERASDQSGEYAFDNAYQPIEDFAPAIFSVIRRSTFDELAAFGELTWHIAHRLDLTGGIRFAHNDQDFTLNDRSIFETAYVTGHSAENITTWMLSASYRLTPEVMVYVRVATGSQPGSPNGTVQVINDEPVTTPQQFPPTVDPEIVTNYEVGLKSEFFDRAALFDLSMFYINWNDIQLGEDFVDSFAWANGGKATSKGVEVTGSYAPLAGLRLGYGAAYTQSELTSVSPGAAYMLLGYQLADIPKWSMAFTADYNWPLTDVWAGHVAGTLRWIDKRWGSIGVQSRSAGGGPTMEMPSYSVLDFNASIAKGPLLLRAFVRNLTDTRATLHSFVQGDADNPPASLQNRILQPRLIGVGFDYAF